MIEKKELMRRLDKLTSVIVRVIEPKCCTCGKTLPFNRRQAGHFIPRGIHATRWDLRNVHTQCAHCNVELGGNIDKYKHYIVENYGDNVYNELYSAKYKYDHGLATPFTQQELISKYNHYLLKVRKIEAADNYQYIPKEWKAESCYTDTD